MDDNRAVEDREVWIVGSGTAALASALYLIKHTQVQPSKVHVLDIHASLEEASHKEGNASSGYDQFAGCLPVPGGTPMKELLSMVPSTESPGQSLLQEIETAEKSRLSASGNGGTSFLVQVNGYSEQLPIKSLNLGVRNRMALVRFLLRREKTLAKHPIEKFFPKRFFESVFWAVWSAQFGFQPWHSAAEFRRAIQQYFPDFHRLSILNGLDITGYYQYEYLYRPIYSFLQNCGVDFHFGTQVKDIEITESSHKRIVSGLHLVRDKVELHRSLKKSDIVLVQLGSTISGSTVGTNDIPPVWQSMKVDDMLDQNWSAWLDLGNKHRDFGDPYSFCTRQTESMLESFTITTEDVEFFDTLKKSSKWQSEAGVFIFLKDSNWKINLCIPSQPVFPSQPPNVRVLWGLAHSPENKGNYVNKQMLQCPGTDIMTELLGLLNLDYKVPISHTLIVPRAMPRMSAMLMTRSPKDRPQVIPQDFANVGLIGHFVETPRYTCVDVSYGVRTAQTAVSALMGLETHIEPLESTFSILQKALFWP